MISLNAGMDLCLGRSGVMPPVYDSASSAAFAAMTVQPDETRKDLIDTMIRGLKADGVWPLLDWLCILAAHDEQAGRLNLRNPAKALTPINLPTFTLDRGFTGDAATSYLHIGEAASDLSQFALNSASAGIYCNQQVGGTGGRLQLGVTSGGGLQILASTASTGTVNICDLTGGNTATSPANGRRGFRLITRESSAQRRSYLDGAEIYASATASSQLPSGFISIGRLAGTYAVDRFAAFCLGASLTAAQVAALSSRILAYLTAIGAN